MTCCNRAPIFSKMNGESESPIRLFSRVGVLLSRNLFPSLFISSTVDDMASRSLNSLMCCNTRLADWYLHHNSGRFSSSCLSFSQRHFSAIETSSSVLSVFFFAHLSGDSMQLATLAGVASLFIFPSAIFSRYTRTLPERP